MSIKSINIKLDNMVCVSCEQKTTNVLKNVTGVFQVKPNYKTGFIKIKYDDSMCTYNQITTSLEGAGYSISKNNIKPNKIFELIYMILIIILGFIIINTSKSYNKFNISDYLGSKFGLAALFIVGMLTSLHCIGMCGGIMLSQNIKFSNDSLTSKLKPAILYNLGRVISYTLLGFIVGGVGSVFSLSIKLQGSISLLASIFVIIMGFNIYGFNLFRRFAIHLPFNNFKVKYTSNSPFVIGILNGFMPCGPLQTMQLYALASGSAFMGGLSMFIFAIGTVPLMIILGIVVNISNPKSSGKLIKFSGIIVVMLGLLMLNRGLALLGVETNHFLDPIKKNTSQEKSENNNYNIKAVINNNKQTIRVSATVKGYVPETVYIQKDIPTEFIITGDTLTSCNNQIVIPSLNIKMSLSSGDNIINFTPHENKDITYTCWMGMLTGRIKVVDDLNSINADYVNENSSGELNFYGMPISKVPTNRLVKKTSINGNIQSIDITSSNGDFEPAIVLAKDNIPLTLNFNISDSTSLDGIYTIYDETVINQITTFKIVNGKCSVTIPLLLSEDSYGIVKDDKLFMVLDFSPNPDNVDVEDFRKEFF